MRRLRSRTHGPPPPAARAGPPARPATAHAAVPEGATWREEYIEPPDRRRGPAPRRHPAPEAHLPEDAKTPVIAIISPYLGHAADGIPSDRFKDLFEGAKVFERGYTVVMVDLRGSGGSEGCLDILGPGEQADIKRAVEWAAEPTWSNGRVGMYGKSYDGNTGVAGAALRPEGPRRPSSPSRSSATATAAATRAACATCSRSPIRSSATARRPRAAGPSRTTSSTRSTPSATAPTARSAWRATTTPTRTRTSGRSRDFVAKGKGSTVPFLMTHGFLDTNTNIGAKAIDFYNGLAGPEAPVARLVGPRARQRHDAERHAGDGPRGLVRRGHALLRRAPQGDQAGGAGPGRRRAGQRRHVAQRAGAGRPPTRRRSPRR